MGFDHFAILATRYQLNNEQHQTLINVFREINERNIKEHHRENFLFGVIHHLITTAFPSCYWERFDHMILELYLKTGIENFYLYVCEYDGEHLYRYEYLKGKRSETRELLLSADKIHQDFCLHIDINKIYIENDITEDYNENYHQVLP